MRKLKDKWLRLLGRIFWPSSIEIAVSTREITARLHRGNRNEPETFSRAFSTSHNPQEDAFYVQIDEFLSELFLQPTWQNQGINFILGADVVRYFFVLPFEKTRSLVDCVDAAKYKFQQIYGAEDVESWTIQGQWSPEQSFLACAVHKKLLLIINAYSKKSIFRIDSVHPHFILIWNQVHSHLSTKQWLLINEKQHLIIGIIDANGLSAIRITPSETNDQAASQNLNAIIKREALTSNLSLPDSLLLVGDKELPWGENFEIKINPWEDTTKFSSAKIRLSSLLAKSNT